MPPIAKIIVAESPTARRRAESWQVVETFHETSLQLRDVDASVAAPGRPNKKNNEQSFGDYKFPKIITISEIFVILRPKNIRV